MFSASPARSISGIVTLQALVITITTVTFGKLR